MLPPSTTRSASVASLASSDIGNYATRPISTGSPSRPGVACTGNASAQVRVGHGVPACFGQRVDAGPVGNAARVASASATNASSLPRSTTVCRSSNAAATLRCRPSIEATPAAPYGKPSATSAQAGRSRSEKRPDAYGYAACVPAALALLTPRWQQAALKLAGSPVQECRPCPLPEHFPHSPAVSSNGAA